MQWRNPTVSMWDEALQLLERADRLHRQFFQIQHHANQGPTWAPPVDVFETNQEFAITVALPGVTSHAVTVTIDNGTALIRGQRGFALPCDRATVRRLEIPYGHFERRIALPPGQCRLGRRFLQDRCLFRTLTKLGSLQ